jgi:hypothetical protein
MDFLGQGWAFPPQFSELTRTTRMVSGIEDIRESLFILLRTRPGERVMLPAYGCDLDRFIFQTVDSALLARVRDTVTSAVVRWEPRIELLDVEVSSDPGEPSLLLIELSFQVRRTNIRSNLVYPFYLSGDAG